MNFRKKIEEYFASLNLSKRYFSFRGFKETEGGVPNSSNEKQKKEPVEKSPVESEEENTWFI